MPPGRRRTDRSEWRGLAERLARLGTEGLADHELLALALAPRNQDRLGGGAQGWTLRLLAACGGLAGLARLAPEELRRLPGLGPAGAARLLAALEIGRRLAAPPPPAGRPITTAAEVAEWFRGQLQHRRREGMHALLLDGKHRPLRHLCLAEGSWTSCPVDPKVIFAACLRHEAPALILIHNHPSGDPTPSRDDLELTDRLVRAGQVVGVRVLDHLIVGSAGFTSLADAGLL